MIINILFFFFLKIAFCTADSDEKKINNFGTKVIELTDNNWDQIQRGQWIVGFFDKETDDIKHPYQLDSDTEVELKKLNINVGSVFAPQNPVLYVRFLVTVFPKFFYIRNGVAHEVTKLNMGSLLELIKDGKLNKLKPVNFLSNPFSVQMALLSNLFVHAVNLYNYEHSIVQKFISAPSATDVVFGLTFIIVGTILGLLMTCAFGLLQIFFMDSRESEEKTEDKDQSIDDETEEKEEEDKEDITEKSKSVRKRK